MKMTDTMTSACNPSPGEVETGRQSLGLPLISGTGTNERPRLRESTWFLRKLLEIVLQFSQTRAYVSAHTRTHTHTDEHIKIMSE